MITGIKAIIMAGKVRNIIGKPTSALANDGYNNNKNTENANK